jgi:type IV secretion system protein VirB6
VNPVSCQQALEGVGAGVAASLQAVDCAANATAQAAFGRLFAGDGALLPALTILLTLYVAFFAFSLITGRSSLRVSALTPRMLTVGLVLTFATSWIAYQGVMWNLAVGAPDQIAGVLMGTSGSSTQIFAEKIDVVFAALIDASSQPGAAEGQAAQQAAQSTFSPPGLLWLGATLLLLGTVGILATCKIALAVLLAIGPVFVVLALFEGTRGLFVGWLKGLVMLAVTPLFAVLGGSLMLELAVPVIRAIGQTPGKIDARAAMAFFMIGAVHAALMIMMLKVAGTMVAGWTVFGLARGSARGADGDRGSSGAASRSAAVSAAAVSPAAAAETRAGSAGPSREIRLAQAAPVAANDAGPATASGRREATIVTGAAASSGASNAPLSRTRGVGSRFRAPPARSLEKTR